ncbi:MAG: hypothetical protein ACRDQU_06790 [Pseudonocardiaceae bacterium]
MTGTASWTGTLTGIDNDAGITCDGSNVVPSEPAVGCSGFIAEQDP